MQMSIQCCRTRLKPPFFCVLSSGRVGVCLPGLGVSFCWRVRRKSVAVTNAGTGLTEIFVRMRNGLIVAREWRGLCVCDGSKGVVDRDLDLKS